MSRYKLVDLKTGAETLFTEEQINAARKDVRKQPQKPLIPTEIKQDAKVAILLVTILSALTFLGGTLLGWADPDGYAAWRVGLIGATVVGSLAAIIAVIIIAVRWTDA